MRAGRGQRADPLGRCRGNGRGNHLHRRAIVARHDVALQRRHAARYGRLCHHGIDDSLQHAARSARVRAVLEALSKSLAGVLVGNSAGIAGALASAVGWNDHDRPRVHTIGAADGGPGLPVVNFSTQAGDSRISHALGLHALQILPLVGYWLGRALGTTMSMIATASIAAVYAAATSWTLVAALTANPSWAGRGQSNRRRPSGQQPSVTSFYHKASDNRGYAASCLLHGRRRHRLRLPCRLPAL